MMVIWLAPSRVIPNYGEANTGDEKELPDELAALFINQGEAKPMPQPKKVTKETEL